jgi:uncharacterized protein (TIGR03067 family)
MRTLIAALTVVAMATAASVADDPKSDLDRIQGKWKALGGPNKDYEVVMTVAGSTVNATITSPDRQEYAIKGEIKLDEKARPKQLDWIKFAKPDGGGDYEPNLAIYELDGDSLRICSGGPGRERPTELKAGDMGRPSLLEYKRMKEEPKKDEEKKEK